MYSFNTRIRYSETGEDGKLTLGGLLNYFQDCSFFHSEDLGVGLGYLNKNHMAWVLSSWQIVMKRYPDQCEHVKVSTAPYDFRGFLGYRNFRMDTEDGRSLAAANSIWTLLDTQSMLPRKAPGELVGTYEIEEKMDMEYAPRKITLPEGGELMEAIVVKTHHLDTNRHVNNVQYVNMALDSLGKLYVVTKLRAEYRKSAVLGDVIIPRRIQTGDNLYIVALQGQDGTPFCITEFQVSGGGEG